MARKPVKKTRTAKKTVSKRKPAKSVARKKARARKVQPIPAGYHSVTPYLTVNGAAAALAFYKKAFGAVEKLRMEEQGRVGHAEIQIGTSRIMLADEYPEMGMRAPQPGNPPPVGIMLYVRNVDVVFKQAVAAGATVERPLANQFYGDRTGGLIDPFGHRWYVGTHIENVSPKELERRLKQMQQTT